MRRGSPGEKGEERGLSGEPFLSPLQAGLQLCSLVERLFCARLWAGNWTCRERRHRLMPMSSSIH
jgi:hypothetical protein